MERIDNRNHNQLRDITIEPNVNIHAEGSVLISFGNTKVICNASIENNVPRWRKSSDEGWVTGEYGMLPRSTNDRMNREPQSASDRAPGRTGARSAAPHQRWTKRARISVGPDTHGRNEGMFHM